MAEIPEFKKCFFYIPLRLGLIAWGYFNLIVSLVMIGLGLNQLILNIQYNKYRYVTDYQTSSNAAVLILTYLAQSLATFVQLAFSILLIVAGHKINTRLLNICYKYGKYRIIVYVTAMVIVNLILCAGPYNLVNIVEFCMDDSWRYLLRYNPALGIIDVLLQCYFVLLLRSYLLTLDNNNQFKPLEDDETENTEAECSLEIEREGQTERIVIKNIKIKFHD